MLSMFQRVRAYLELTLAMTIVGSSVIVGKLVVLSFPVFLAAGLRFAIGSLVLVPLLLRREGFKPAMSRRDWLILFCQAFTGAFLFTILLFYGLKLTNAAEAGLITSATPAVIGLLSFLFLKEKLAANKIIGIVLTVGGVLLGSTGGGLSADHSLSWCAGNLLVFGAVVGEALFTIFRKTLPQTISPLFTATMMSLFSFVLFLPLGGYEAIHFDFTAITPADWGAVFYYGVVVTAVAFILWFQGVSQVPASTAAVFTGVMPVSAVLFSYLILHESFRWAHLWGGLCVLLGLGFIVSESWLKPKVYNDSEGTQKPLTKIPGQTRFI